MRRNPHRVTRAETARSSTRQASRPTASTAAQAAGPAAAGHGRLSAGLRLIRRAALLLAIAVAAAVGLAVLIYIAWVFGIVLVQAIGSLPLGRPGG